MANVSNDRPVLILSFDGGGVKGTMTAEIVKRLSDRYPDLVARTDVFAGTSTGSLMASLLAVGYAPSEVSYIYKKFVPKLFAYTCWDVVRHAGNIFKSR